jgi:hypothetical protein
MKCPACNGALELVSHDRYAGLRFPGSSMFRCAEHGPLLFRRDHIPPLARRFDAPGDRNDGHSRVRVPLVPRPTPLAGAIALPEPDDDDRPADRVAAHRSFG